MKTDNQITICTYKPGDPSLVYHFYYKLYEQQYNFNGTVEGYLIRGMVDLFDYPHNNQLWVAKREDKIVGSVAIIKKDDHQAQLRWFGVDMSIQGMGISNKLLEAAMRFCKEKSYTNIFLWTIDILKPARHLYGKNQPISSVNLAYASCKKAS